MSDSLLRDDILSFLVGEAGDVASSVARAVARNRKNFPELGEK